jgi:hypothetical protein
LGVVSKQQEYLWNADQCCEMAALSGLDDRRETLFAMAGKWRELAADEERIADLVRAVDELFPPKVGEPVGIGISRGLFALLQDSLLGRKLMRKTKNGTSCSFAQVSAGHAEPMQRPRWLSQRIYSFHEVPE